MRMRLSNRRIDLATPEEVLAAIIILLFADLPRDPESTVPAPAPPAPDGMDRSPRRAVHFPAPSG
jgi:hypothetical protein